MEQHVERPHRNWPLHQRFYPRRFERVGLHEHRRALHGRCVQRHLQQRALGELLARWQLLGHKLPFDYSIQPFLVIGSTNYGTYWFPSGQPHNDIVSGSNTTFRITGMYTLSQISQGWVARSSGTMTGTTCGTVQSPSIAGGGIATNICQHHGDSGAPLFSQIDNRAYGLSITDTTKLDDCPSGYISYFTPMSNVVGTHDDGVTISVATSERGRWAGLESAMSTPSRPRFPKASGSFGALPRPANQDRPPASANTPVTNRLAGL